MISSRITPVLKLLSVDSRSILQKLCYFQDNKKRLIEMGVSDTLNSKKPLCISCKAASFMP